MARRSMDDPYSLPENLRNAFAQVGSNGQTIGRIRAIQR
jgi:hypothetical protein